MNIASYLTRAAEKAPSRIALVYPSGRNGSSGVLYQRITFEELDRASDRYAKGLTKVGVRCGRRALLMVPPGREFIALTFALFKVGAVVILIDPGMGRDNLLHCIGEVEPEVLVAVPLAHALRVLYRKPFARVQHSVTVGRRWFWGGHTLDQVQEQGGDRFSVAGVASSDTAAIVFTTGSTGIPKGVVYCHGLFDAQVRSIQSHFQIEEGEVGLAAFAPFALFCVAMGTTCVLPHMDATRPADVDPTEIVRVIRDCGATYSFGSPTFWHRVAQYCSAHGISLEPMKTVIMAGAPVSSGLLRQLREVLAKAGETHTPYGATEALPVTSISGSEVLDDTAQRSQEGAGICVGRALPGVQLRIIRILDGVIPEWAERLVLPLGEIGEIVVKGSAVAKEYYKREEQTALAKIRDGGSVWHRMGDVGYLDEQERLWFCGRKSERVIVGERTLFTVPCEAIFNQHRDVFRSALVGIGPRIAQRPVIIIEPKPGKMPVRRRSVEEFTEQLLRLGGQSEITRDIKDVLFHPKFPVDFRHNAKIGRDKLAAWAEGRLI